MRRHSMAKKSSCLDGWNNANHIRAVFSALRQRSKRNSLIISLSARADGPTTSCIGWPLDQ